MDEINKSDLKNISNDGIRKFYLCETIDDLESPIKEYVEKGISKHELGKRLNEVERLLDLIIIERFLNKNIEDYE